ILIEDNQWVKAGDTLFILDDRDLKIKVQQAEIALRNAEANLNLIRSNLQSAQAATRVSAVGIGTAEANIENARIRVWKSNEDFKRYTHLLEAGAVTQQQYDAARAEKESAEKQLLLAQRQQQVSESQNQLSSTQERTNNKQLDLAALQIEQKQSELNYARLQLSYATITSPANGYVSRKNIQEGQWVNGGQNLFSIVDEGTIWVTANFKETQIEKMKVGQKVEVKADAYPGELFEAEIESFSAATGAKFSLLPPDNSSGNFVKVVQRIPVRIHFKPNSKLHLLRAGMNVKVIVHLS
ncbi:MAG TPA: HlyD family secretion protein, partial [Chitinophagaceae bacterium]|nr:HlyD family secretion protein [Chitinophagaceae bacterium]